jgi:hypothetical protein
VEHGVFFAFFCLDGTFKEDLDVEGVCEAAFGDGLGDALDGDLSGTSGERLRPLPFFLGLLFFFFWTFDDEVSTAAADSRVLLVAGFLLTVCFGAAGAPAGAT